MAEVIPLRWAGHSSTNVCVRVCVCVRQCVCVFAIKHGVWGVQCSQATDSTLGGAEEPSLLGPTLMQPSGAMWSLLATRHLIKFLDVVEPSEMTAILASLATCALSATQQVRMEGQL